MNAPTCALLKAFKSILGVLVCLVVAGLGQGGGCPRGPGYAGARGSWWPEGLGVC